MFRTVWTIALACVATCCSVMLQAADVDGVRVAKFKGNREAAISFTLDDGWEDAATLAAPIFDKYGLHATFFLVPGRIPDDGAEKSTHDYGKVPWKVWKSISEKGHEIGSHTLLHPSLTKADDATLENEVNAGYQRIVDKLGIAPISFAYPYNARDERVRKVVYAKHAVAREFETGYGGNGFSVQKADSFVDAALKDKRWMVPMIHAIEHGYAQFSSASVLDEHLKYVQSQKDRLWVDTFGNIGRYVKERDAAKLEVKKVENGVSFTLTTSLDSKVFCVPLTVIIDAKGVASAEAKREGEAGALPVTVGADCILVDVVPGAAPVLVTWRLK